MHCLGIDYGEKRIGLSYGDELGIAIPLPAAISQKKANRFNIIATLIEKRSITHLVVGYPYNMDDSIGFKAKEVDLLERNTKQNRIPKLDLHGYSLSEANIILKKFIIESFNYGCRKILIITGKGSRSKSHENPYISEKLSVLKYSVPEYIKNDENLANKINSKDSILLNTLGLIEMKIGNYELSEKLLLQSIRINNEYANALNNLAALYQKNNRF